jgi:hypothetical protein
VSMETTTEVKLSPELRKKLEAAVKKAKLPPIPWSATELTILREYYPRMGPRALEAFLPGRTGGAIRKKAEEMGLRVGGDRP